MSRGNMLNFLDTAQAYMDTALQRPCSAPSRSVNLRRFLQRNILRRPSPNRPARTGPIRQCRRRKTSSASSSEASSSSSSSSKNAPKALCSSAVPGKYFAESSESRTFQVSSQGNNSVVNGTNSFSVVSRERAGHLQMNTHAVNTSSAASQIGAQRNLCSANGSSGRRDMPDLDASIWSKSLCASVCPPDPTTSFSHPSAAQGMSSMLKQHHTDHSQVGMQKKIVLCYVKSPHMANEQIDLQCQSNLAVGNPNLQQSSQTCTASQLGRADLQEEKEAAVLDLDSFSLYDTPARSSVDPAVHFFGHPPYTVDSSLPLLLGSGMDVNNSPQNLSDAGKLKDYLMLNSTTSFDSDIFPNMGNPAILTVASSGSDPLDTAGSSSLTNESVMQDCLNPFMQESSVFADIVLGSGGVQQPHLSLLEDAAASVENDLMSTPDRYIPTAPWTASLATQDDFLLPSLHSEQDVVQSIHWCLQKTGLYESEQTDEDECLQQLFSVLEDMAPEETSSVETLKTETTSKQMQMHANRDLNRALEDDDVFVVPEITVNEEINSFYCAQGFNGQPLATHLPQNLPSASVPASLFSAHSAGSLPSTLSPGNLTATLAPEMLYPVRSLEVMTSKCSQIALPSGQSMVNVPPHSPSLLPGTAVLPYSQYQASTETSAILSAMQSSAEIPMVQSSSALPSLHYCTTLSPMQSYAALPQVQSFATLSASQSSAPLSYKLSSTTLPAMQSSSTVPVMPFWHSSVNVSPVQSPATVPCTESHVTLRPMNSNATMPAAHTQPAMPSVPSSAAYTPVQSSLPSSPACFTPSSSSIYSPVPLPADRDTLQRPSDVVLTSVGGLEGVLQETDDSVLNVIIDDDDSAELSGQEDSLCCLSATLTGDGSDGLYSVTPLGEVMPDWSGDDLVQLDADFVDNIFLLGMCGSSESSQYNTSPVPTVSLTGSEENFSLPNFQPFEEELRLLSGVEALNNYKSLYSVTQSVNEDADSSLDSGTSEPPFDESEDEKMAPFKARNYRRYSSGYFDDEKQDDDPAFDFLRQEKTVSNDSDDVGVRRWTSPSYKLPPFHTVFLTHLRPKENIADE